MMKCNRLLMAVYRFVYVWCWICRPGVGAKVSAKARRKREDRERLQSVLAKNVKFSKRKDSLKAAQKGEY